MAVVTTNFVAPWLAGGTDKVSPIFIAQAAGYVATSLAVLALVVGMFLPEPKTLVED
jgi:hypothetical protein